MEKIKALFLKYKEIIMYLIFGGCTTLVSWGSYALFVKGLGISITVGNILSWVCAVAFAFVTNKLWVFESKSWSPKTILKEVSTFVSARIFTGVLEWFGVPGLVKLGLDQTIFGVDGMWSKVIVSIAVVILNYVFSKLIVFAKRSEKAE